MKVKLALVELVDCVILIGCIRVNVKFIYRVCKSYHGLI